MSQPVGWASQHSEAAATAVKHLQDADAALRAAFTHPHHNDRLDNVSSHLKNLASIIEVMPSQEESRSEYAKRVLAHHADLNKPMHDLPDSGKVLLQQELEIQKAGS